jgi:hypothetical protein
VEKILRRLRLALLASTMALLASITTIVMAAPVEPFAPDAHFSASTLEPASVPCTCSGAAQGRLSWSPSTARVPGALPVHHP